MKGAWTCHTCRGKYNKLAKHIRTRKHIEARTKLYGEGKYYAQKGAPPLWQRK